MGSNPQQVGFTVTSRAAAPQLASIWYFKLSYFMMNVSQDLSFNSSVRERCLRIYNYKLKCYVFNSNIFFSVHVRVNLDKSRLWTIVNTIAKSIYLSIYLSIAIQIYYIVTTKLNHVNVFVPLLEILYSIFTWGHNFFIVLKYNKINYYIIYYT